MATFRDGSYDCLVVDSTQLENGTLQEGSDDEETWAEEIKKLKEYGKRIEEPAIECPESPSTTTDQYSLGLLSTGLQSLDPTPKNVLVQNKIIVCILKQMERQVLLQLRKNREEQEELESEFRAASNKTPISKGFASYLNCGMPFFKDAQNWGQPKNAYVIDHEKQQFASPAQFFQHVSCWTPKENKKLSALVTDWARDTELKALEYNVRRISRVGGSAEALEKASVKLETLRAGAIPTIDPTAVDWLRVATDLNAPFSPQECLAQWTYTLHPYINRSPWTEEEILKLAEVVKANRFQSWDKIAHELGTRRSSLQCCITFQRKIGNRRGPWTDEDNAKLEHLFKRFSIKSPRPLRKVSYFFPGRTVKSIFKHLQVLPRSLLKRVTGKQDNPGILQIAERAMRCNMTDAAYAKLKRQQRIWLGLKSNFSPDDDRRLLDAIKEHGTDWEEVEKEVPGRTKLELLQRHKKLQAFSKSVLQTIYRDKKTHLLPANEGAPDVWRVLQMMWEPANGHDHSIKIRCGIPMSGFMSLATQQMLRLFELGHTGGLFSCRIRTPGTTTAKHDLAVVLAMICRALSLDYVPATVADRLEQYQNAIGHSENVNKPVSHVFLMRDVKLPEPRSDCHFPRSLFPPNIMTLMGARVLGSSRGLLLAQADVPDAATGTPIDLSTPPENRLSVRRAKELLKKRMSSLFFLSLCMARIARTPDKYEIYCKQKQAIKKVPAPLALTKLAKKRKAKMLNDRRWKKEPKVKEGTGRQLGRPRKQPAATPQVAESDAPLLCPADPPGLSLMGQDGAHAPLVQEENDRPRPRGRPRKQSPATPQVVESDAPLRCPADPPDLPLMGQDGAPLVKEENGRPRTRGRQRKQSPATLEEPKVEEKGGSRRISERLGKRPAATPGMICPQRQVLPLRTEGQPSRQFHPGPKQSTSALPKDGPPSKRNR